jgi:hypothetical protein
MCAEAAHGGASAKGFSFLPSLPSYKIVLPIAKKKKRQEGLDICLLS